MTEPLQLFPDGPVLSPGSADPLLLGEPGSLWQVDEGQVALFAVELEEGRPCGRRHLLLRVQEGELLMGLPSCEMESGRRLGFIAVGSFGARVRAGSWSELGRPDADGFARLVDSWIISACAVLGSASGGWPEHSIGNKKALELSAGDWLYGQSGRVRWLVPDEVDLELMGAPVLGSAPVPVTGGTWVTTNRHTSLASLGTEELISAGRLESSVRAFHGALARHFATQVMGRESDRVDRCLKRERIGKEVLGASLRDLAAVIRPGRHWEPMDNVSGSPMYRVCTEVARAMGLEPSIWGPGDGAAVQAKDLSEVLKGSKLRHRRVLLRDDWWRRDNGPIIGYRLDRTPVALLPQGARRYRLVDPITGESATVDRELADSLQPHSDVLYRPFSDESVSLLGMLRFGLRGVGPDLKRVFALGVAGGLLALALPMATGFIIDKVLPRAADDQLWQIVGGMLAAVMGIALFGFVQSLAVLRVESRLDWSLQSAVFDRLLKLPTSFFREYTTGDLSDRVLGIQAMRQLLSSAVIGVFLGFLFSIFSFLLLFAYSVHLALIAGLLVVFSVLATLGMGIGYLRQERNRLTLQGRTEGLVLQLINGVDKLRVADAASRALAHWARQYAAQKRCQSLAGRWANGQSIFHGVYPILSSMVIYASVIWTFNHYLSAADTLTGPTSPLSTGDYLAFNAALGQFMGAMGALALTLTEVLGVIPLHERSRPVLETPPERRPGVRDPGVLAGQIELSSVTFRYARELPLVLDGMDLQIEAGELVAIVGASGSGKSTVVRLLLGFEQTDRGEVFYDGQALTNLDIQSVRSQIGVVLQNGRIQVGSIFENIVGGVDVSVEDAWRAARLAGLEEDIDAMPMGMHTVLTADGRTLSGGQRQRLLIARALVNKPRILFLDEATSALDNRTQAVVTDTLGSLNITRVLIAHRLSTIRCVDRIIALKEGKVAETGSYDELFSAKGVFYELATRQLLGRQQ